VIQDWGRVLPNAKFDSKDSRVRGLVEEALSLFPSAERPLRSVVVIRLRERSSTKGRVGLTTFSYVGRHAEKGLGGRPSHGRQRILLYNGLLSQLSDEAAMGVIAHELAHAWLNEHVSPQSSKRREAEADEVARSWGYGRYLDALDAETYSY
jgi:predicted Zn-dependent protease with MMP-like domain